MDLLTGNILAVVDIETSDWIDAGGTIVEVGIAGLDTDTGEVAPLFDSVCRQEEFDKNHEDAWIFSHSSLTVEDVKAAPDFEDLKEEIQKIFDLCVGVTAYNRQFDVMFLRLNTVRFDRLWTCPMEAATPLLKLPQRGGRKGKYKYPSVMEAWAYFFPDRPYDEEHRGLDDAMHEAEIVWELMKKGLIKFEKRLL